MKIKWLGRRISAPCPRLCLCLAGWENRNPIEIAGLLVHKAVHALQELISEFDKRMKS